MSRQDWFRITGRPAGPDTTWGSLVVVGGHVPSAVVDRASSSHRLPRSGPWDRELTTLCH